MSIKIIKREPMSGEELDVSIEIPERDRQKFENDPEAYVHAALEAAGQKVNGVVISQQERSNMLKNVGGKPMEVVVAHVESPKSKSASKHIIITI